MGRVADPAAGGYTARRARPDEFDVVMELLGDSVRWLHSRGLDQWSGWRRWRTKMRPSLRRGDVWLFCDGEDLVGTVTVELHGDPDFWDVGELAEPAAYVSKVTIRRSHAGRELGALLLGWAGDHAYRHGCRWLRLDAWKTNTDLHRYYTDRGWTHLRTSPNPLRSSGALFQTEARPLSPAGWDLIREVPPMPVLATTLRGVPDGGDPAGNTGHGHMHVAPGLIVNYPDGHRGPALMLAGWRYRIRQDGQLWLYEASPNGAAWWEQHGTIASWLMPMYAGMTYVSSHQDSDPCEMSIVEVPERTWRTDAGAAAVA